MFDLIESNTGLQERIRNEAGASSVVNELFIFARCGSSLFILNVLKVSTEES